MTRKSYKTYLSQKEEERVEASGSKRITRTTAPDTDNKLGYFYSDIIPIRCIAVSSMVCVRETDPVPYSPVFQALAGRLNDPAQTDVLSAVIRGQMYGIQQL